MSQVARPSALGAVCYEVESAFGENVSTFATARLAHQGTIDASGLEHALVQCGTVQQVLQGRDSAPIVGVKGGSFKIKLYLCGHGSTTSGAMSATDVATILGYALGGSSLGPTGTTAASGGTTTSINTVASGTYTAGQLFRSGTGVVGATAADGRGSGLFNVVVTHAATVLTPKLALPGALNAADVIYSAETIYLNEITSTITGLRFALQTNGMQYECHGCYPKSVTFSGIGVNGEIPMAEIEYGVAWWKYNSALSFPSSTSVQAFAPAPCGGANSRFFLNAKGTSAIATRTVRSVTVTVALNTVPMPGPGGNEQYQVIVGAVRTPAKVTLSWTEDSETATTTPIVETDWTNTTAKHCLFQLSGTAGSAVGFYFPQMWPSGNKPVQMDDGGLTRVRYTYECSADTSATSTDLLCSAMKIGFA